MPVGTQPALFRATKFLRKVDNSEILECSKNSPEKVSRTHSSGADLWKKVKTSDLKMRLPNMNKT